MAVSINNVSVIVPALNEEAVIADVVRDLREELPEAEVIVVNDGSIDETAPRATKAGATVLSHEMRRGYGSALRTGIEHTDREYVVFCDGDGQHNVKDVHRRKRETMQMIQEATEEDEPMGVECSVCTEGITKHTFAKLQCGHQFHRTCINQWFQRKRSCPLCRAAA